MNARRNGVRRRCQLSGSDAQRGFLSFPLIAVSILAFGPVSGPSEALSSSQKMGSTEDDCHEASGGNIILSA